MATAALLGGLLAFGMLLAELRVVQLASSLSLAVAGILKEVLTVVASAALLREPLTPSNVLGLVLCCGGMAGYQYIKRGEARAPPGAPEHGRPAAEAG